MDPVESMLSEATTQLGNCQDGKPVDTAPLRAMLISATGKLTAEIDVRDRQHPEPGAGSARVALLNFARRLEPAADLLDAGDCDGARRTIRRALGISMTGQEPPDLRAN